MSQPSPTAALVRRTYLIALFTGKCTSPEDCIALVAKRTALPEDRVRELLFGPRKVAGRGT